MLAAQLFVYRSSLRSLWYLDPSLEVAAFTVVYDDDWSSTAKLRKWVSKYPSRLKEITTHRRVLAYESSSAELEWLDGNRTGKICSTAMSPQQVRASNNWLQYSTAVYRPDGHPPRPPLPGEVEALSRFHVGNQKEYIEPLHGIARNPFSAVGCGGYGDIFDLRYLVLQNRCAFEDEHRKKPRTVLFDLGASMGFAGVEGGIYKSIPDLGGGLLPSIPLFMRLYRDRCLDIDEVYAWEVSKNVPAPAWWGALPPNERAKIRFYEVPVEEGSLVRDALAGTPRPSSFLMMLDVVAHASTDDFIILKLDIDTPRIEQIIVDVLAERPEIAAKIDEMFFEYHFSMDGMDFGWGSNIKGDVDTALGLMHRLRSLGIRAHFWI